MISRYSLRELSNLWAEASRWANWLKVEKLVCEAWAKMGQIPPDSMRKIGEKCHVDPAKIARLEKETKHDVIAFVQSLEEQAGRDDGRFIHMGLTSSDILDTGLALQLVEATERIEMELTKLLKVLKRLVQKYRWTPMVGRTHGMHAEPITFGLKLAGWYAELSRQQERLAQARETVAVGKIAGAVGHYGHVPPQIESYVLGRLGLKPESVATQVVSRDRHAFYFSVLAGVGASIEKIAVEIRHLARSEIGEVEEPFAEGQKGSSAMPHKKNPILSENLTGLARLLRAYAQAALENVALWHERDISHSSVERVIAPDATILIHFMIHRLLEILGGLKVYPERMRKNLESSAGQIFSQPAMLSLVRAGLSRKKAYEIVQRHAMQVSRNGTRFQVSLARDPVVRKYFSRREIQKIFDLKGILKHVDLIIDRAIGVA